MWKTLMKIRENGRRTDVKPFRLQSYRRFSRRYRQVAGVLSPQSGGRVPFIYSVRRSFPLIRGDYLYDCCFLLISIISLYIRKIENRRADRVGPDRRKK